VREVVRGYRPAKFFLLAWSGLLVFILLGTLRNFGLAPANFATIYCLHIGLVLDVLLLSFGLGDRINTMRAEKEAAQAEALATERALLEATQRNERELEHRVAERTLELNRANDNLRREAGERESLMSQLRESEERMRFMAQHDALTGLPNRYSMQERLSLAIEVSRRNRKMLAVMLVDLDKFKAVNDTRGHAAGDQLLATVANRLRTSVRASDTVARLGGDEFVILAGELDRIDDAAMVAEKVSDMVSLPVPLEGGPWNITCSIGIAIFPRDAEDAPDLLALADKAMYGIKGRSGDRSRFHSPA
jgi:diguanylate cyclase (GGDEF)-like protein